MLTGTLDDFTLPDVLRLIAGARRTGGLAVARAEGAGELHFRDGSVVRAVPRRHRSNEPSSPARAIEDLAFDLMRWERGEFTWTPDAAIPAGAEASVDVDELLRAVANRLEELAEIHTLVPSEEAVLTMAPQPPEGAVQINITPAEWRVLVLVDGHRTVSEIAGAAHLDDLEAMKLLYGLAAAGLVAAGDLSVQAPSPQAEPHAAGALAVPEDPSSAQEATDTTDTTAVSAAPAEEGQPEPVAPAEEPDPFLAELSMDSSPFGTTPAAPAEAHEDPAVDRSTAARELAGLFDDVDPTAALGGMRMASPPAPPRPGHPRRVEDDDQVTRGLISRLIDGVKGL